MHIIDDICQERIAAKRKENRELLSEYKQKLDDELYKFCLDCGGHYWSNWENRGEFWAAGWVSWKQRTCWACNLSKTKDYRYPVTTSIESKE